MIFKAREPRFAYVPFLLLCLVSNQQFLTYYLVPLILLMMMLRYELHIHEDEMQFQFKLLDFRILTRRLTPGDIKQIEFKRAGWSTKRIVVRVRKGIRWSIIRFQPEDFPTALRDFAERHSIRVDIHRDFNYL